MGLVVIGPEGHEAEARDGELSVTNVDPDSWGTDARPALHDSAFDSLRHVEFNRAVRWVHPENQRARRFYETRGWQTDAVERVATRLGIEVFEVRYSLNLD